jgi:hypothetical protein
MAAHRRIACAFVQKLRSICKTSHRGSRAQGRRLPDACKGTGVRRGPNDRAIADAVGEGLSSTQEQPDDAPVTTPRRSAAYGRFVRRPFNSGLIADTAGQEQTTNIHVRAPFANALLRDFEVLTAIEHIIENDNDGSGRSVH